VSADCIQFLLGLSLLALPAVAWSQTETVLHSFGSTSADGFEPTGGLLLDTSGNLFGTTFAGSETACDGDTIYGCGIVFELVNSSGSYAENILYSFGTSSSLSDGASSEAGLVSDASADLYGTTYYGGDVSVCPGFEIGDYGCGTVLELVKSGTGYTENVLYSFMGPDGAYPYASLTIDSAGNLYGTTYSGGACSRGEVFELVKSSQGYAETILHSFGCTATDGSSPYAGLIMDSAGNLYGTTESAGDLTACGGFGCGIVFELVDSGGDYTEKVLYSFIGTNGEMPVGGLISDSSGNFYGTTEEGGANGDGTVFELVKSSSGYTEKVLYSFRGPDDNDGQAPVAGLVIDQAGDLYGTTSLGGSGCGSQGCGIVFELANSLGAYTEKILHYFGAPGDGDNPSSQLVMDNGGNLYGTTDVGGATVCDCGTVFQVNPTAVAPVATLSLLALTFSNQVVSSTSPGQSVSVTNTGSANLTFGSDAVTLTGQNAADFVNTANTCGGTTVAPEASCSVTVTFSPSLVGSEVASLNIAGNAANSPQVIGLSGAGVAAPAVTLTPGSLTFPSQPVRTESTVETVSLSNTGAGQLTISSLTASPGFIESTSCGSTLAPGGSCVINLQFEPTTAGVLTGTISIVDNALNSPQTVNLTGTGSAPEASVSPASVTFGSQIVGGTSGLATVNVLNTGNAGLTISLVAISEGNNGDFAIAPTGTTCVANDILSAGSNCAVNLTFTPTASGTRTATLTINDNSNGQADTTQSVALSGTGEDFGMAVAPGTSSSATVAPGETASYSVSISPLGGFNQTVTLACAGAPSQTTCSVTPGSLSVNGGSASMATVTVATQAAAVAAVDYREWESNSRLPALLGLIATYPLVGFLALATLIAGSFRDRRGDMNPLLRRSVLAAAFASATLLVSCSGGGNTSPATNPGTPPGTYTLTVTGTSGNLSHSTTLTLTIN
jgi:uncharacterized repeat protein (TIGR03803 family)